MYFGELNYLAILLCGVANLFIGGLWYGPIFGKAWQNAMNLKKKDLEEMQKGAVRAMVLSFIGSLVMAVVFAGIIHRLAITSLLEGLLLAFLIWIAFEMVTRLNAVLFEKINFKLFILDTLFDLLVILAMGAILTLWK